MTHFGGLNQVSSDRDLRMFQCCCTDQNQMAAIKGFKSESVMLLYIKFSSSCILVYDHDLLTT